jgi:hypothetical protein
MKIGSAFPSKYIKVEDLQGRRVALTIDRVKVEEIGQGDDKDVKPVVYFVGKGKGLALNRINATTISEILGTDETDEWHGRRIVLHPDKTMYQGKRVDCIRVAPAPKAAPGAAAQPVSVPPPPPAAEPEDTLAEAEDFLASDEDVAFLND